MLETPLCLAFPALIVIGSSLLLLAGDGLPGRDALCSVLLGLGMACDFVVYVRAIRLQPSPLDAWCLIAGTAGGAVLYFVLSWLPAPVVRALVIYVITPLCGALAVAGGRRLRRADAAASSPALSESRWHALRSGLLSLVVPVVSVGVIAAVMTAARLHYASSAGVDAVMGGPLNMGLILGALVTLAVYLRTCWRVDTSPYSSVAVPFIAFASFGLPFFGDAYGAAFTLVLYVLFVYASIDLIRACSQAEAFYGIAPTALYTLSFGVVYTLRFAPTLVFALVARARPAADAFTSSLLLALVFVTALFAAYMAGVWLGGLQRKAAVYTWATPRVASAGDGSPAGTDRAFSRFAENYGLTPRESEVARFFIEGRTVPYIAERLVVSESTVKYHSKNIYRKCGVTGRQELLDLYAADAAPSTGPIK